MRRLLSALRVIIAGVVIASAAPVLAQNADEAAWQKVITGQIEAFRQGDAPVAFSYAGAGFQQSFPTPRVFLAAILASGYAPIIVSKAHSFGTFQRKGDKAVVQVVKFIGPRQEIFRAIYQLVEEDSGWRVAGVVLGSPAGVEI